ncbi:MAG: hypothetical protein R2874_16125 [Desulfobacterales bacterium]
MKIYSWRAEIVGHTIKFFIFSFIFLFVFAGCANRGQSPNNEATQIEKTVLLFGESYGTVGTIDAANVTSTKFRDGIPAPIWAQRIRTRLELIEYRRIKTEIVSVKIIDKENAVVIARADIKTIVGSATQQEKYFLIRPQEKWLIDDMQVQEEETEFIEFGI